MQGTIEVLEPPTLYSFTEVGKRNSSIRAAFFSRTELRELLPHFVA
jgi:hypothetical protein